MASSKSQQTFETCLILNKKGNLALDMQPGGYAFLNYKEKACKWVFIKSNAFPNAFSLRPVNNIELALTYDQRRNAAVVKPCKFKQALATQFWGVSDRDTLFTILDATMHLNIDRLEQKVGTRAYLTNLGPGYLSSSDDEDAITDFGGSQSSIVAADIPSRFKLNTSSIKQQSTPRVQARPQYNSRPSTSRQAVYSRNAPSLVQNTRVRASPPQSVYSSMGDETLFNDNRSYFRSVAKQNQADASFVGKLDREFTVIQQREEAKHDKRRRAAILQEKLANYTTSKTRETKYWIEAFKKVTGEDPDAAGAQALTEAMNRYGKIIRPGQIVESSGTSTTSTVDHAAVQSSLELKLAAQHGNAPRVDQVTPKIDIRIPVNAIPDAPSTTSSRRDRQTRANTRQNSTRYRASVKRSGSLESLRSNGSVRRTKNYFEDVADRESTIATTVMVDRTNRGVMQGIEHWENNIDFAKVDKVVKRAALEEQIRQVEMQLGKI